MTEQSANFVQVVNFPFVPTARFQTAVVFEIFACKNNIDSYTEADSMNKLAKMTVEIKNPSLVDPPSSYRLIVVFTFGAVELQAYAIDKQTGAKAETSVVFISD